MTRHYEYEPIRIIAEDQIPAEIIGEDHTTAVQNTAITAGKQVVPTVQIEAVRTHPLPSRATGWKSYTLTLGAAPIKILDEDRRRKRAVIFANDVNLASQGVRLGQTQAEAASPYAFQLIIINGAAFVNSQPLEYTSYTQVWASAIVASCVVSVLNEQWSD